MRRRRLLLGLGLLALLGLAGGLFAFLYPWPGVTGANFERIQEGMTLAEVEKILGGPPHDRGPIINEADLRNGPGPQSRDTIASWTANGITVFVKLDEQSLVKATARLGVEETLTDRLRRLLPW
jgi:hypothetical protein